MMIERDRFRNWTATYIQTIAFLSAYFMLVVAGNLIFASPWGEVSLNVSRYSLEALGFRESFTLGYWLLLFGPLVVTPLIVVATRRHAGHWVSKIFDYLPDFRLFDFTVIFVICLAFVAYEFWKADVLSLFTSGNDALASVEARFEIRARIGFFTFMPLEALMTFMSFYAIVRAQRERSLLWWLVTGLSALIVSILLTMINMKWPVLVFYLGLVAAIFIYSRRWPYLKTTVGLVVVCICYVAVSTFVFRIAPDPVTPDVERAMETAARGSAEAGRGTDPKEISRAQAYAEASIGLVPSLAVHALNRMAISYPYYYHVFTEGGAVCGGVFAQAMPHPGCRPSYLIYEKIFPGDGFGRRGTSPMPAHVSGYAYGGWPVAALAMVLVSAILGLFASIPLDKSSLAGAVAVTGAVSGYHFSQVPGEGVIFYEHGLFWVGALVCGYVSFRALVGLSSWQRLYRSQQQPT